jgi:hypothetical protein
MPLLETIGSGSARSYGLNSSVFGLAGDPFAANLQLALPLGGSYGTSDYSATIRKSGANKTMTTVRGAGTNVNQSKFYESSYYAGQFNDRNTITTPNTSSLHLGTQDFCIEMWFYFTSVSVGYQALASHGGDTGDQQNGWIIIMENNNSGPMLLATNGSGWPIAVVSSTTPTANSWNHLAVTRSGSTFRIFLNGVQTGTQTTSTAIASPSSREFRLGNYLWFPGGERGMNGYIQDFRMYVGVAKYTSNFTPPSAIALGSSTKVGLTSSTPASSIASLRSNGVTGDGVYWFSTNQNPTPFKMFCKFNYLDGGDWGLLLKVHNRADMPSGSAFWTNTTVNNADDWNLYSSSTFSKYNSWNGVPFTRLAMDMGGRIPPIMIYNTSRTFAQAITASGATNSSAQTGLFCDATDPAFGPGAGHDYSSSSQFPMKVGSNFSRQSGGLEWYIQGYGIGSFANTAGHAIINTSDAAFGSLPTTAANGAWIGAPLDEGTHTFNNPSNGGADSGFGFGMTCGNVNRTTSAGYAEWNSGQLNDTLPGYVWIR